MCSLQRVQSPISRPDHVQRFLRGARERDRDQCECVYLFDSCVRHVAISDGTISDFRFATLTPPHIAVDPGDTKLFVEAQVIDQVGECHLLRRTSHVILLRLQLQELLGAVEDA